MWLCSVASLYQYTNVMCSPPLTSHPVLCPFLFLWHQLWQDETVVVCLPVYTCCADLLLLYSRHRQADRWQPHWHQNRRPQALPLAVLKLQVLYWNGDNNMNRWSLKFSINVLFQAEVCVNKILMIYCQCTAVFWLHNFLIYKVSTILLKLHDLDSSICFKHDCECECLTSSSLNQDRLSAVRINQYSLAPPFMKPMLLMVSQPLRMTCTTAKGKEVR